MPSISTAGSCLYSGQLQRRRKQGAHSLRRIQSLRAKPKRLYALDRLVKIRVSKSQLFSVTRLSSSNATDSVRRRVRFTISFTTPFLLTVDKKRLRKRDFSLKVSFAINFTLFNILLHIFFT